MFLTAVLCARLLVAATVAVDDGPKKELAAAVAKLAAAPNYSVVYDDGSAAEKASDPHVGESPDPAKADGGRHKKTSLWSIQWSKEQPTHLVRGRAEFWRLGKKYVALGRADAWIDVPIPDPRDHAELRGMARIVFDLERLQLPHVLLNGVERRLASVTRTERDGKVCFEGPLDPKLVHQLLGGPKESAPPKDPQHGEEKPPVAPPPATPPTDPPASETPSAPPPSHGSPEYSGTLRVVVAAGAIESVELELALRGTPEARQLKRRFDVSEIGTTKIDVPPPASKLLHAE